MQSNNPVFRRSEEFNGQRERLRQPDLRRQRQPVRRLRHRRPARHARLARTTRAPPRRPMTIDSVVQKTAISLAVVIVTAAATWIADPRHHATRPPQPRPALSRR